MSDSFLRALGRYATKVYSRRGSRHCYAIKSRLTGSARDNSLSAPVSPCGSVACVLVAVRVFLQSCPHCGRLENSVGKTGWAYTPDKQLAIAFVITSKVCAGRTGNVKSDTVHIPDGLDKLGPNPCCCRCVQVCKPEFMGGYG